MTRLRRWFLAPIGSDIFAARVISPTLTAVGVFTFLAGAIYLPLLAPARVELILCLLRFATVALLCTALGQLAVVIERLEPRSDKTTGWSSAAPRTPRAR